MAQTLFRSRSLANYLHEFDEWQHRAPGPITGSIRLGNGRSLRLLINVMTHGNETGSLPAILEILSGLGSKKYHFGGEFTVLLGNRAAVEAGRRFVEQDLNRVFSEEAPDSLEKKRAFEMMPVLAQADLMVDLHQTIEPTDRAFYTFGYNENLVNWATYLGGTDTLITRRVGEIFAQGLKGADEYAREKNTPAVVFESSQMGMSAIAFEKNVQIILRAMQGLEQVGDSRDLTQTAQLASAMPPLQLFGRTFGQKFVHPELLLKDGFQNFDHIQAGQEIGQTGDGRPLTAEQSGFMLFPKYPPRDDQGRALDPRPSDLYLLYDHTSLESMRSES